MTGNDAKSDLKVKRVIFPSGERLDSRIGWMLEYDPASVREGLLSPAFYVISVRESEL